MIHTTLRTGDARHQLEIDCVSLLEAAPDVELLDLIAQQFVYTCSAQEVAGLAHDSTFQIGQLLQQAKAVQCGLIATFAADDVLAWLRVARPHLVPVDPYAARVF